MSRYIAKQVKLSTMEGCKQPGCSCFTRNGYYIQYRNGNSDCMLFVCENCYEDKFRMKCSAGDFDEERYIVKADTPRYQPVNSLFRTLMLWTQKTARIIRIAMVVIALILVTAFGIKERPAIRTEITVPQWHTNINTNVHVSVRNPEQFNIRLEAIGKQITRVFTHGGREND